MSTPSSPQSAPGPNNPFNRPPDVNTADILMPTPEAYKAPVTEAIRNAEHTDMTTRAMVASLGVSREVTTDRTDIEVQQTSERAGILYSSRGIRIPTYSDRYFVFDGAGRQMFDANGKPLDMRVMPYKASGKRPKGASYPMMVTIEGKYLVPFDQADQRQNARSWIGGKIYGAMDRKWDLEALESKRNSDEQKIIQETVGNGPDEDERIIFSTVNVNGRLQKYDGTPLTREQINKYHTQLRIAKVNQSRYQGVAAYEIGKREEQEQGGEGVWLQIVNTMHQNLGYSREQIDKVTIGLQYMKKSTYLSFKHRGLELFDANGNPVDESKHSAKELEAMRQQGSYYRFGKLKERGYAIELADKVVPYQYTFSAADVADALRLSQSISDRLDAGSGRKNAREYQNAAYILRKLKLAVDASKMSSPAEPGKEGLDAQGMNNEARLALEAAAGRADYPPRISGSAAANDVWRRFAKIVDDAARKHPIVHELNLDLEYPSMDLPKH